MKITKRLSVYIILVLTICLCINSPQIYGKTVKKNGYYHTGVYKNNDNYEYSYLGNNVYLKKYKISNKKIVTYGGFGYRKKKSDYGAKISYIKAKKRTFKISGKCKYYTEAWTPGGEVKVSREEFFIKLKSSMKANRPCTDLELQVKNGKVVKMKMGQG